MKKQPLLFLTIILILSIVLTMVFYKPQTNTINMRIYDENLKIVKLPFSVYPTPIPSNYFIDLTIGLINDGSIPLTCDIFSLSPPELDSSLVRSQQIIKPGNKVEWTSNLISLTNFAGRTQRFEATARCSYNNAGGMVYLNDSSNSVDIQVKAICGDGLCDTQEDRIQCPQDCFIGPTANFRTSKTNYPFSYHEIAFTRTCGNKLTKYSFGSPSLDIQKLCTNAQFSECPFTLGNNFRIVNKTVGYPSWANKPGCIYQSNTYSNQVYMMWRSTTNSICPMIGTWQGFSYMINNTALISDSPYFNSETNEVMCW